MTPKDQRPKARLPRGLADRTAADIRATDRMIERIRRVYERYGFQAVETPLIEYTDALGKFLPDLDRPNEGVFSFRDEDAQQARATGGAQAPESGEWLSLRYDLTAPLARYVAENYQQLPKPYRSYRFGWVFRNEKPGPGRFRQFMQFDADTVGASSPAADAEMCMMAADALEEVGIPRGQYAVRVSSRRVLDGLLEVVGLTGDEHAKRRLIVLRAIDKFDRLGWDGVQALLGKGRKDESGDFTHGAELASEQIMTLGSFFMLGGAAGWRVRSEATADLAGRPVNDFLVIDEQPEQVGGHANVDAGPARVFDNRAMLAAWSDVLSDSATGAKGIAELRALTDIAEAAGYGSRRIQVSPFVVRGLEYYTGAVFEAALEFQVQNDQGQPVVFGSVGGGGRYDGLVGRFLGEDVPATGFSVGVSRLQAALAALGKSGTDDEAGPVVVLVMDRDRIGDYQAMVARLRNADIAAEMYLGDSGMRAQMKYADRRNAPLAIIQGGDEKARGIVQIKDLVAGKKAAASIADNKEWRAERPGQEEVREDDLVEAVNRLLGFGEPRGP